MTLPDIKALKKLASACRSAGIKHFKGVDFEFTLSEEPPVIRKTLRKTTTAEAPTSPIADDYSSDSLTQEQLLMYSVMDPTEDPNQRTIG